MKKRNFMKALAGLATLAPALAMGRAASVPNSSGRRVSADENDPNYSPACALMGVTLDGKRLQYCTTADEARGEAICLTWPQPKGYREHLVTHVRRGVVKIYDRSQDIEHLPLAD